MSRPRPPTAREQLAFLRSLQRLMDEGSFVASYKFPLLHAIADLCLVKGDDSGAELELSTSEIAEQFIRLYWPQVVPYPASAEQQDPEPEHGQTRPRPRSDGGPGGRLCEQAMMVPSRCADQSAATRGHTGASHAWERTTPALPHYCIYHIGAVILTSESQVTVQCNPQSVLV